MTTARAWEIEDFKCYLTRKMLATGQVKRTKNARMEKFIECLFDGYAEGKRGPEIYRYARNKACGLSPLAWIQLLSLLWSIYLHFVEWKNRRQTVVTKDFE